MESQNPDSLVWLDESGIDDNEHFPYGWAKIGDRAISKRPAYPSQRMSMIAVLNKGEIKAPLIFLGTCNKQIFEEYVEKILLPEMSPGQTLILDNAKFHTSVDLEGILSEKQCFVRYLPPYSPDMNPIEHQWFKIKNLIKKFIQKEKENFQEAICLAFRNLSKAY